MICSCACGCSPFVKSASARIQVSVCVCGCPESGGWCVRKRLWGSASKRPSVLLRFRIGRAKRLQEPSLSAKGHIHAVMSYPCSHVKRYASSTSGLTDSYYGLWPGRATPLHPRFGSFSFKTHGTPVSIFGVCSHTDGMRRERNSRTKVDTPVAYGQPSPATRTWGPWKRRGAGNLRLANCTGKGRRMRTGGQQDPV